MKEERANGPATAVAQMGDFNALSMYFDSEQFATAQRVCQMLSCSDLVPKEYRYTPMNICNADGSVNPNLKAQDDANRSRAVANCMIALNKAALLHSDPLTIMQSMGIVYGRPSWSSTFLIGTVNSCGRYTPLKFEFGENGRVKERFEVYKKGGGGQMREIEMPNMTCIAYATEKSTGDMLKGSEVSIRMAYDELWIQKDGSKWLTMPQQMLMYRAAAFWTRAYAPDIVQGMYTADECTDIHDAEVISTTIDKPERQRIQLPAPDENVEQIEDVHEEKEVAVPQDVKEVRNEENAAEVKTEDAPY